ncbi:sulfatase-like hydrolase/transferase [Bacteroides congonensis]|uniref:sulfatase-like hydrolase/transferase n=1 Tax=Bacteroides congonensis TaxID=1871006 RepID=UPI0026765D7A|nr:sulfatase-like hydrolase/transferase [Bacteroides congonensis]
MEIERPALLMGALIASSVALASNTVDKTNPNILFILVDDLGLGDLSCQYAKDLSTPNIDRIFETGVRLDNFYANSSVSSPSRAALLTGRFPAMVGVPGVIRPSVDQNWGYFAPSAVTMPDLLKSGGYSTALIGKWHLGWESPNLPNERGFDHFHGFLADMMDDYYTHRRQGGNYMFLNDKEIDPKGHATDLFTSWSVDYIKREAKAKNPFFLYLAYNAPHSPLQPPVEWVNKVQARDKSLPVKRARLIALIEHLDYNIGKVMQALKESGQLDNTLVIFASDNGGDRGSMANNGPIRGAKGDMFEGGIRVPCALNMPGVFEGGRRDNHFIVMMDLLPTICELLKFRK